MIVAYTRYDEIEDDGRVTAILSGYAQSFISEAAGRVSRHVEPGDLDELQIVAALDGNNDPFFFFGHGELEPPCIIGQDRKPLLPGQNGHLLRERLVYATACYSIGAFRDAVNDYQATVVGYDGELAIIDDPKYEPRIEGCILAGARALLQGKPAGEALDDIKLCFTSLARDLIRGDIGDQVVATFVEDNANVVALLGNAEMTL